ncbi:MAG: hypothetical protein Q8Q04_00550 [archaeon]|nr:hypothetical protein [archaeon]
MAKIDNEILKRAVIAGASAALKVQRKRANLSEENVLGEVISGVDSILDKMDRE